MDTSRNPANCAQIKSQIGRGQQSEDQQDRGLALLSHFQNRPGDRNAQSEHERHVGRERKPQPSRAGQQQGAGHRPRDKQQSERPSAGRLQVGPVPGGGQKKAGDHGHGETEDHFVRMPLGRRQAGEVNRQGEAVNGQPRQHGKDREPRRTQEKRTKTS